MSGALCRFCGEEEEEHHEFLPYIVPKGCICNPRDWANPINIPDICSNFMQAESDGYCSECAHVKACHGGGDAD